MSNPYCLCIYILKDFFKVSKSCNFSPSRLLFWKSVLCLRMNFCRGNKWKKKDILLQMFSLNCSLVVWGSIFDSWPLLQYPPADTVFAVCSCILLLTSVSLLLFQTLNGKQRQQMTTNNYFIFHPKHRVWGKALNVFICHTLKSLQGSENVYC